LRIFKIHIIAINLIFALSVHSPGQQTEEVPPEEAEFDSAYMAMTGLDSVILDTFITGQDSIELWNLDENFEDRYIENKAFGKGEKLSYSIQWNFIGAGSVVMSIPEITTVDGRECYHVITEAKSNWVVSHVFFYKVRDRIETFIDIRGLYSRKFEKRLKEGRYKKDYFVSLDQERGIAKSVSIRHKKGRDKPRENELRIPPYIQDILSAYYYFRTLPIEVGENLKVNVIDNDKMYPMKIIAYKKERKKVKAGTFDCIVLEPLLKSEGLFRRKGRVWVWLTDDEKRIPVLIKSKAFIGWVKIELKKIEGVENIPAMIK